ncbi:MAG: hypothetical protein ACYDH9_24095 [Limisphaerales bacterium]
MALRLSNINGVVLVNGQPGNTQTDLSPDDLVETGQGSSVDIVDHTNNDQPVATVSNNNPTNIAASSPPTNSLLYYYYNNSYRYGLSTPNSGIGIRG